MERNSAEIIPVPHARSRYIQYSRERDLPMMLAVRNATYISHSQLWEHVQANGSETSRRSFNWRTARLTQAGVIESLPPMLPYPGPVYTITRAGLACLEACGEGLVSLTSESKTLANRIQMQHYLELAEVRAAFRRAGVLREWASDLEIRSIKPGDSFICSEPNPSPAILKHCFYVFRRQARHRISNGRLIVDRNHRRYRKRQRKLCCYLFG